MPYQADTSPRVYWQETLPERDDFGSPYIDEMFDAPTIHGPRANMTRASWNKYRQSAKLGTGYGQRYLKTLEGRWLKVEG